MAARLLNWAPLSEVEKKKIMNIPAYMLYGVNTDEGVLMRKANVPRSIANKLGAIYGQQSGVDLYNSKTSQVNDWLKKVDIEVWRRSVPVNSKLTAEEYRKIWEKLNY